MVNEKYLLIAENLAERNKNLLDAKRSPKEKEIDELFYWIMSRLEWAVRSCSPIKKSYIVKIQLIQWYDDGSVLLKHGTVSDYLSEYVMGEEFYDIMEAVASVFNEIGQSDEKGYHFSAICILPEYVTESAELIVRMEITE